jgi:hypothetical protein
MTAHKLPEGAATNRGVEVMEQWCDGTAQPVARDVRRLIARIRHEAGRADWNEQQLRAALATGVGLVARAEKAEAEAHRLQAWLKHIEGGDYPCTDEILLRQWAYDATTRGKTAPTEGTAMSDLTLADNTWARESNLEEAKRQEEAKAVADRLWARTSSVLGELHQRAAKAERERERWQAKSRRQSAAYRSLQAAYNERDRWWRDATARVQVYAKARDRAHAERDELRELLREALAVIPYADEIARRGTANNLRAKIQAALYSGSGGSDPASAVDLRPGAADSTEGSD